MKKGIYVDRLPGGFSEEGFALATDAGFDGIELETLFDDDSRRRAAQLAVRYGLSVPSIVNMRHWQWPLSDPDANVRRQGFEAVLASIETAVAVGADTVLLVPAIVTQDVSYREAWTRSQGEIAQLVKVAEEKKITIALENVFSNRFLFSPLEFADYIDQFRSSAVAAYFDVGNVCFYGFARDWIATLGARIRRVHVKGFDERTRQITLSLLDGTLNWPAIMSALRNTGYDGWLIAEPPPKGPRGSDAPHESIYALSKEMHRIIVGLSA